MIGMMEIVALGQMVGFIIGVIAGYHTMEWWLEDTDNNPGDPND